MILPDHAITIAANEHGLIDPFDPKRVQPASYDLTLDRFFRVMKELPFGAIDPASDLDRTHLHERDEGASFLLRGFALASTVEQIKMPANLVARVEGKSSLARLGLFVHVTAGFIDPGFEGHVTLELFCAHDKGIILYPGMPVCQIAFERLESPADKPYGKGAHGSKYLGQQRGPTPSAYWKNFLKET